MLLLALLNWPDALTCDMQRFYGLDVGTAPTWQGSDGLAFGGRPITTVATLVGGLFLLEDSLVYREAAKIRVSLATLLTAAAVDRLSLLLWAKAKRAKAAKKPKAPTMLVEKFLIDDNRAAEAKNDTAAIAVPIDEVRARIEAVRLRSLGLDGGLVHDNAENAEGGEVREDGR